MKTKLYLHGEWLPNFQVTKTLSKKTLFEIAAFIVYFLVIFIL